MLRLSALPALLSTLPNPLSGSKVWLAQPKNRLLLALGVVVFPLGSRLGQSWGQLWDESRLALRATEPSVQDAVPRARPASTLLKMSCQSAALLRATPLLRLND
jgi:hypothetical protein